MKAYLDFSEKVFSLVKRIPKGKVSTYKDVAAAAGKPKAVRFVGWILKNNTDPENIPCYKIVMSDGSIGGYCGSSQKNIRKKIKLLEREGIEIINGKINLKKYRYCFKQHPKLSTQHC